MRRQRSRVQAPAVHEAVQPTERHAERGQRLQRGREPPSRGLELRLGHKRVQHVDVRRPAVDLPVVCEPERLDRRLALDGGHPAQRRGVNLLGLRHLVRGEAQVATAEAVRATRRAARGRAACRAAMREGGREQNVSSHGSGWESGMGGAPRRAHRPAINVRPVAL